jgi:hypothetical protein
MLSHQMHTFDRARTRRRRFIEDAAFSRERGISIIPLDGKRPPSGFSWKPYTERFATKEEIQAWAENYSNLGNICGRISGLVGLDADSLAVARMLYDTLPRTAMMTRSSEGKGHFYYRLAEGQVIPPRVRINGMQLDIRGEVSYLVSPWSIHPESGRRYERVGSWDLKDVPFFDPSWIDAALPQPRRMPDRLAGDEVDVLTRIARARSYLAKLDPAVSGAGGHNRTMYAAGCLVQKFGLTIEQAWPLLLEYNDTKCSPKWTARELLHKLESAVQNLHAKGQNHERRK